MAWVRLDDKFHSNPKVLDAGLDGSGLYARALAYCGDHLTDGFVPMSWAKQTAPKRVCDKVSAAGLWTPTEDGRGYRIPDYLEIGNPSRDQVEERRKHDRFRKESGRNRGGIAQDSKPPSPVPSPDQKTTGSSVFSDIDIERRRELERIYVLIRDADDGTAGVLMAHARKLPFGAIAKVRESVESQRNTVGAGWVVNALKSELAERAA